MSLFDKFSVIKMCARDVALGREVQIELKVDKIIGEGLMEAATHLSREEQHALNPQGPNIVPYVGSLRKTITFFQGGLIVSWPV